MKLNKTISIGITHLYGSSYVDILQEGGSTIMKFNEKDLDFNDVTMFMKNIMVYYTKDELGNSHFITYFELSEKCSK